MFSEPVIIPPIRGADPGEEALARRYLQIKIKRERDAGLLSLLPYLQSVAIGCPATMVNYTGKSTHEPYETSPPAKLKCSKIPSLLEITEPAGQKAAGPRWSSPGWRLRSQLPALGSGRAGSAGCPPERSPEFSFTASQAASPEITSPKETLPRPHSYK